MAAPAQNFRLIRIHGCHQNGVLVALRSGQLQGLVFCLEGRDLVLGQEVQNCPAVGVLIVDDVAGRVLDRIPGVARLGCHIIANAVNGSLCSAAAIGQLSLKGVLALHQRHIGSVKALLHAVAERADRIVHTVETVGDGTVQCVGTVADTLGDSIQFGDYGLVIETTLDGSAGFAAGVDDVGHGPAITAAGIAPAIVTPAQECEEEQNDNEPAAFSVAKQAVTSAASASASRLYGHGERDSFICKGHIMSSFFDIFF